MASVGVKRQSTMPSGPAAYLFTAASSVELLIAAMTPVLAGDAEIGTVRTGVAGRALALLRLDRAIEAIDAGKALSAGGRAVRLDAPSWLILPQRDPA